jgi:hypothetical protein
MDYRNNAAVASFRGIRNNNPGNYKSDGPAWQGAVGSDGVFYIFADDTWGLRAMAKDLTTKIGEGVDTITTIITKYAPPSENDTASYIAAVSSDTGIDPDTQLGTDQDTIHSLIRAIVNHENGSSASQQFISDADIDQGIAMAGNPATVFQAAAIAAQANPLLTVAILLGSVWLLSMIYGEE